MWQMYVTHVLAFVVGFVFCAVLAQDRVSGSDERERRRP